MSSDGGRRRPAPGEAPGAALPAPVAEELALLEAVAARLRRLPPERGRAEAPLVRELERVREELVSGGGVTDRAALSDQWHRGSALLRQLRSSREAPRVDPASPYFAHLRLREEGAARDLCLGRATCIRDGIRIVDWRHAPVSRIYYRYEQGEEYEEAFAGRVHVGTVEARRGVAIRDGHLDRVDAPEGSFEREAPGTWRPVRRERTRLAGGEAAAVRGHGVVPEGGSGRLGVDGSGLPRRVDRRLPEITSLLDPSQFELIARPSAGFLAIRGTAGSGKTTVALHRIAYLAYDDPAIDSPATLFVVFSPGLRNFVGHVLPALGVTRVGITTFHEWAGELRRRHFPALPSSEREDAPALVQRLKLHPLVGRALALQVQRHPGPARAETALEDWASALGDAALLNEAAAVGDGAAPGARELAQLVDWQRRRNEELFAHLAGDVHAGAQLEPEDDALLLRAWQLRVGPLRARQHPLVYRHLVIDEVQDFATIEVQLLLGCLDEHRSLTLAGDTQQHVVEGSGFTSWGAFLEQLGVPGTAVETLRVCYRSTREIAAFARTVLGDLAEDDEPPQAPRSGPPVESFRFTDRGACVAFLVEALRELATREPLASVAILTPSRELSALYHRGLARGEVPRARQVLDQDWSFLPGTEVAEIEQAKGLEFDYVVLTDVDVEHFPDSDSARRRLHVGATRAIHQLWLAAVGTPSSLAAQSIT